MATSPSLLRILGAWLVFQYLIVGACGRITLEGMRNLTQVTRECRGRIEGYGVEDDGGGPGAGMEFHGGRRGRKGGRAQVIFGGGEGGGDDIEDTITAALRILCSDLLIELEKPLLSSESSFENSMTGSDCTKVKKDFDEFLKETTRFLYEIQERQMEWRWASGSAVKGGLVWLQGLWASRRGNSQDRSFIEQQMVLYRGTGCFEKLNRDVLRKDIEVVEYLNDLIDMFW